MAAIVSEVSKLSPGSVSTREELRSLARKAIRSMESSVVKALDSEPLRGLVDLNPSGERFLAAHVQANGRHGVDTFLIPGGKPVLVIGIDGCIVRAFSTGRRVTASPVVDDDLATVDVESVARAYIYVLERHVARSDRTARTRTRTIDLANAILDAIERST